MRVSKKWNGLTFLEQMNRAGGRAIVGIGMQVTVETKRVTHVVSGNLKRSVHAAEPGADHGGDEREAQTSDLMMTTTRLKAGETEMGPALEVGSWMPYACVEWVGRMHPGIQQGLEMVRGARADAIVALALREEGL